MKEEIALLLVKILENSFSGEQLQLIKGAVYAALDGYEVIKCKNEVSTQVIDDESLVRMFLVSKKIDGLSDRTIEVYRLYLRARYLHMYIKKPVVEWTKDDLRMHFARRMIDRPDLSKVTLNNERRYISAFFTWLTDNDYVSKNPMSAVKKIKESKKIKEPIPMEQIIAMRDKLAERKNSYQEGQTLWKKAIRDMAVFEFLLSTGCRVAELCGVKLKDINLEKKEVKVFGKGSKERMCYLNIQAVTRIKEYLEIRNDDSEYLFIACDRTDHPRLEISGVEIMVRELGRECGFEKIHPHRFRRTAATMALNRGMPIEEVQMMLGHEQIDTTLIYAKVSKRNVKSSHEKYM